MLFTQLKEALLHLAFPHVCAGCGTSLLQPDGYLCLHCLHQLPQTNFHLYPNNPIEKIFWGRLPVTYATSQYYFTKESRIQQVLHGLKYRGHKELGVYLGTLMGQQLAQSNRFSDVDALIPLPLFPAKERARGYNQAGLLCQGIASVLNIPVLSNVVIRTTATESQTAKNRVARWENMEGRFVLVDEKAVAGKHLLLVDDVITTGATLETCGRALQDGADCRLSIATLCYSAT